MATKKWWDKFDERQQKQIDFARVYAHQFGHGADGHNNMLIISKMADELDALYLLSQATYAKAVTDKEIAEAQGK
jgi:hypothetical protein